MGRWLPKTCWADSKINKIVIFASSWSFVLFTYIDDARSNTNQTSVISWLTSNGYRECLDITCRYGWECVQRKGQQIHHVFKENPIKSTHHMSRELQVWWCTEFRTYGPPVCIQSTNCPGAKTVWTTRLTEVQQRNVALDQHTSWLP